MRAEIISLKDGSLPDDLAHAMASFRRDQPVYNSPFFSPDFVRAVSSARPDVKLVIAKDKDGIAALWPMHLSRWKTARGIGAAFSDRNGPLKRPNASAPLLDCLKQVSIRQYTSSGLCAAIDPREADGLGSVAVNMTDLEVDAEQFFERQSEAYSSHFKRLRRLGRKLGRDANIEFCFEDHSEASFAQLIDLKRSQYKRTARHDVLAPDWVQSMLRYLRDGSFDTLKLRLSTLRADGELIAGELNLEDQETLHGWIVAYDPNFGKYSPGHLLTERILRAMPAEGLRYYDSGAGGDEYKKYITNRQEQLFTGTLHSSPDRFNLRRSVHDLWVKAEHCTPEKISTIMSRARGRAAMILATEVDARSRMRGFCKALQVDI